MPRRRLAAAAAVLALAATALTGCGGGSSSSSVGGAPAADTAYDTEQKAVSGNAPATAPQPGTKPQDVSAGRLLARTATLALTVKDVSTTAAKVRALAASAEGAVVSENLETVKDDSGQPVYSMGTIVIAVPASALDTTLDELAKLGAVRARQTSTEDVTAQTVDTEARLSTLKASVDRVRALMAKATTVAELVTLENELERRQADLESLQAQLKSLRERVAQSPVTVQLASEAVELEEPDTGGFLSGLKAGWKAFRSSVSTLLTMTGALLPFLVAIAVVAAPIVWSLRRRRAQRPTPQPRPYPGAMPAGPPAPEQPAEQRPDDDDAPSASPTERDTDA